MLEEHRIVIRGMEYIATIQNNGTRFSPLYSFVRTGVNDVARVVCNPKMIWEKS